MQNDRARGTTQQEERIRQIGEYLGRSVDPQEQARLRAELVGYVIEAPTNRQQYVLRELAGVR